MAVDIEKAIAAGMSKIGTPYVWGAEGPDAFDCSGLVQWMYAKAGVTLPRTSQEQAKVGTAVPLDKIQRGDLVLSSWDGKPNSHIAVSLGGDKILVAPSTGKKIQVQTLTPTYRQHVQGVRRVPGATPGKGSGSTPANWLSDAWDWFWITPDEWGTSEDPTALPGDALRGIAGGVVATGKLANQLMKLALPTSLTRLGAGIAGAVFLYYGIRMLTAEVRDA